MSRTKRVLGGLTLGYAYQGLLMLVGIWLTPFLLRHVGQHDLGVWMVGTQLLGFLALLDIGVVGLTPREVAYASGKVEQDGDPSHLTRLVGHLTTILLLQTVVVALAAVLIWFFMPASWYPFRGPVVLTLITFVALFPARIFQATLDGLQDLVYLGRVQIIVWVSSTLVTVILVVLGVGLYALAIAWAVGQLLTASFSAGRLWVRFRSAMPRILPGIPREMAAYYLKRGFWVTFTQLTTTLVGGMDVIVITKFFGVDMVVPYACTVKLTTVLTNSPALLMHLASPGLTQLRAGGSREQIVRVITALTQATLTLSGLIGCVIVAINRGFVNWWVGPTQYAGFSLGFLAVISMMLRHWNSTANYSVFCFGYERFISITTAVDCTLSAGLYIVFSRWLGIAGIPLGSIVSVTLFSLPRNLTALRKETGTSFGQFIGSLWPWAWRFLLLLCACCMVSLRWKSFTLFGVIGVAAATGIAYLAVMFHPTMRSALGVYLAPRLEALRKKPALPSLALR